MQCHSFGSSRDPWGLPQGRPVHVCQGQDCRADGGEQHASTIVASVCERTQEALGEMYFVQVDSTWSCAAPRATTCTAPGWPPKEPHHQHSRPRVSNGPAPRRDLAGTGQLESQAKTPKSVPSLLRKRVVAMVVVLACGDECDSMHA
jgi:hypothetical protein